jgi:hypothetical protein
MSKGPDSSKPLPPQATILLAARDKRLKRAWLNADPWLARRREAGDAKCRVCRKWHNPVDDTCGCESV